MAPARGALPFLLLAVFPTAGAGAPESVEGKEMDAAEGKLKDMIASESRTLEAMEAKHSGRPASSPAELALRAEIAKEKELLQQIEMKHQVERKKTPGGKVSVTGGSEAVEYGPDGQPLRPLHEVKAEFKALMKDMFGENAPKFFNDDEGEDHEHDLGFPHFQKQEQRKPAFDWQKLLQDEEEEKRKEEERHRHEVHTRRQSGPRVVMGSPHHPRDGAHTRLYYALPYFVQDALEDPAFWVPRALVLVALVGFVGLRANQGDYSSQAGKGGQHQMYEVPRPPPMTQFSEGDCGLRQRGGQTGVVNLAAPAPPVSN